MRVGWDDVPVGVRERVEAALGASIVEARNEAGGFSPSMAARCRLSDGRRAFVKAVSPDQNPQSPDMLRREIDVTRRLPAGFPAPSLLHALDDGHWVVAAFEELAARLPEIPWRTDELARVITAVEDLADASEPSPITDHPSAVAVHGQSFMGWRRLAGGEETSGVDGWSLKHLDRLAALEAEWETACAGDALVHFDIRSDNVLVDGDRRVWFVDWANAAIGAPWIDLVQMLPPVALEGGPAPEEVWRASRLARDAPADGVTALVVALAGFFTHHCRLPDPPGLPAVRRFQAQLGEVTRRWIVERTGWH